MNAGHYDPASIPLLQAQSIIVCEVCASINGGLTMLWVAVNQLTGSIHGPFTTQEQAIDFGEADQQARRKNREMYIPAWSAQRLYSGD